MHNPRPADLARQSHYDTHVMLDGVELTLVEAPAPRIIADIAEIITDAVGQDETPEVNLHRFIPGMLDEQSQMYVYECLLDRDSGVSMRVLTRMSCAVVSEIAQMPWWSAMRLAKILQSHWASIDGMLLAQSGVDVLDLPVPRALNVAYHVVYESRKEQERDSFARGIWERPQFVDVIEQGVPVWRNTSQQVQEREPVQRWTPEEQYASFQAFAAMGARYGAG